MQNDTPLVEEPDEVPPSGSKLWRWGTYGLALALIAAAIVISATKTDWSGVRNARWEDVTALAALVGAAMFVNGALFAIMMRPFEPEGQRVSMTEWVALICSSSLLNFLPMRAGLIGRVAYLRKQHGMGYKAQASMMIAAAVGTVYVYVLLCSLVLWRGDFDTLWLCGLLTGLVIGTLIGWPVVRVLLSKTGASRFATHPHLTFWIGMWLTIRVVDTVLWTGRLWLAAKIFDKPIRAAFAMVLASASSFIELATPLPGGLGLREWVGGLILSSPLGQQGQITLADGTGVMVVDRSIQIVVVVVMGVAALVYLKRCVNRRKTRIA